MSKKPLRALFFDIDDTIYSTTEFAQTARRNAVQAMIHAGLHIDEEECLTELNEVIQEFGSNYERHFDKLIQRLPDALYEPNARQVVVAAGMVAYHQTKFRNFTAYEDALAVLRQLQERQLPLGIITAGVGIKQAEKIVRLGLHQLIDSRNIYITDSIGIAKTNPKIFMRACRGMNAPPECCAYVGDNPTVDVDVPSRIGMITILSRRSGKYMHVEGTVSPNFVVHNFWDVLDVIDQTFEIQPSA